MNLPATFYNGFSVVRGDIIICVGRKLVFSVPDQVRHKPCCIATEDAQRLENLDLGSDVIVSMEKTHGCSFVQMLLPVILGFA